MKFKAPCCLLKKKSFFWKVIVLALYLLDQKHQKFQNLSTDKKLALNRKISMKTWKHKLFLILYKTMNNSHTAAKSLHLCGKQALKR